MALRWRNLALAALALTGALGCQLLDQDVQGRSPLAAAKPSADSVGLEIFFARFPCGDKEINGPLWNDIDEQQFPADLRRALAENGFRVGLVGMHVPDQLARLLKLSDKATTSEERHLVKLDAEPTVNLRVLQTRAGRRNEVVASHVYEELPLLMRDEGSVGGRTYRQAEGRFSLRTFPEDDGRVRLEMLPELQHGEQQQKWVGNEGVMRLEAGRPKKTFDELRLKAALSPGQMLLVTSRTDRPGSLGHYFFTEPTAEALAQKLLIIRLAQCTPDRLFGAEEPKTLDLSLE